MSADESTESLMVSLLNIKTLVNIELAKVWGTRGNCLAEGFSVYLGLLSITFQSYQRIGRAKLCPGSLLHMSNSDQTPAGLFAMIDHRGDWG